MDKWQNGWMDGVDLASEAVAVKLPGGGKGLATCKTTHEHRRVPDHALHKKG